MKVLQPTESYQLSLPDDVLHQFGEGISSFWRPNNRAALQLSSRTRHSGPQVTAQKRLSDRMEITKDVANWAFLNNFQGDWCPDVAAATFTEADGWVWTHAYFVWPDLAVYATVARPPDEDPESAAWAMQAVKSLRRSSTS